MYDPNSGVREHEQCCPALRACNSYDLVQATSASMFSKSGICLQCQSVELYFVTMRALDEPLFSRLQEFPQHFSNPSVICSFMTDFQRARPHLVEAAELIVDSIRAAHSYFRACPLVHRQFICHRDSHPDNIFDNNNCITALV